MMFRTIALWVGLVLVSPAWASGYAGVTEDGKAAVATVQPRATEAALAVLEDGGNAVDAAVAAALTLGVVDGHNSGIGGGSFILIRWADGQVEAIDGRELAPAKAHRDMYLREGELVPELSRTGALAVGIPGAVAAYDFMLRKGGKKTLAELLLPAADLAEKGFAIDGVFAYRLERHAEELRSFPGSAAIFLDADGQPWPRGHQLVQKDLASTYRKIAKEGPKYFYQGEFARQVDQWMKRNGGVVTAEDFAGYELEHPEPVLSRYGAFQIYGFPPPSSGGVHVAQILNILEHFDLAEMTPAQRYHLIAEAMKLAFADRAYWLGDPAFAKVPKGLVSREYAAQLAERISLKSARDVEGHSTPPKAEEALFGKHTTHIAAADKDGNWVAITGTVNTNFGSKVVVPGTGVILNNQMDDFSAQPGKPNIYGLIGAEANSIEPGKRPLSSMSPTVVLNAKGEPVLTLGSAGGPTIITQVVLTLVQTLELGLPLEEALMVPRIHHQWRPDALFVEKTMPEAIRKELEGKGHELRRLGDFGSTQAIGLDEQGQFISVAEPRLEARNRVHE
ncbi:gamma-glutamyltransferase [Marinimicrobium sp. ABcell2]|uniref:gamma-glutamyltransferase n=1 Tax=Marinimicrobium sp. ABcell2 TaxID=3069751 RepID=UPI0027B3BE3F|nr:gamma-glutamyltransferase [Marinimicrobium sp. ABcell2]MDQ2078497.1 gamma-glutamyltransferase [Marinimicrobium sp. ABcell2]